MDIDEFYAIYVVNYYNVMKLEIENFQQFNHFPIPI